MTLWAQLVGIHGAQVKRTDVHWWRSNSFVFLQNAVIRSPNTQHHFKEKNFTVPGKTVPKRLTRILKKHFVWAYIWIKSAAASWRDLYVHGRFRTSSLNLRQEKEFHTLKNLLQEWGRKHNNIVPHHINDFRRSVSMSSELDGSWAQMLALSSLNILSSKWGAMHWTSSSTRDSSPFQRWETASLGLSLSSGGGALFGSPKTHLITYLTCNNHPKSYNFVCLISIFFFPCIFAISGPTKVIQHTTSEHGKA